MIDLRLTGFQAAERRLSADQFRATMRRGLAEGARVIKSGLIRRTPKGRTGRMRRGWHTRVAGDDAVIITNTEPYAGYVDQGTRPHLIVPRNAKALAFRIGNRMVFARSVHHPGTKPQNIVSRTLSEDRSRFEAAMRNAMGRFLEGG